MKDAQANLDGSQIVAPYSGTVMSVSVTGGDVVSGDSSSTTSEANTAVSADPFAVLLNSGSDATTPSSSDETLSASGVIVLADTSEPYLQVYWGDSDWPLLQVNNEVEITFDDRQDQVYLGKITEIDRQLYTSSKSSTIQGEVSLESPSGSWGYRSGRAPRSKPSRNGPTMRSWCRSRRCTRRTRARRWCLWRRTERWSCGRWRWG